MGQFKKLMSEDWLLSLHKQLTEEKLLDANSWHKYATKDISKTKFFTAISAQKREAKLSLMKEIIASLLKEAKIYTDLSALTTGVYSRSVQNGGSTTYVDTGLAVSSSGYMVAKLNSREMVVPDASFSPKVLEEYIKKNMDVLKEDNSFLGTWLNEGKWYIDTSERINSCVLAVKLAMDRGELAIYDLARGESIYTKDFKDVKFPEGEELYGKVTDYQDLLNLKNGVSK